MDNLESIIIAQAREAKEASRVVRMLSTDIKNKALHAMADALVSERVCILSANQKDLAAFDVIEPSTMCMVWKKRFKPHGNARGNCVLSNFVLSGMIILS